MSCICGLLTLARVTVVTPGSVPRLPKPAQLETTSGNPAASPAVASRRRVVLVAMKCLPYDDRRSISEVSEVPGASRCGRGPELSHHYDHQRRRARSCKL